jgi:hypothetical protein
VFSATNKTEVIKIYLVAEFRLGTTRDLEPEEMEERGRKRGISENLKTSTEEDSNMEFASPTRKKSSKGFDLFWVVDQRISTTIRRTHLALQRFLARRSRYAKALSPETLTTAMDTGNEMLTNYFIRQDIRCQVP